jgi:hypothetical protein
LDSSAPLPIEELSNRIQHYLVCELCAQYVAKANEAAVNTKGSTEATNEPSEISLQDYTQIDAGLTHLGIQVWCRRHNFNIVHIDFQGHQLPADFRRLTKI